jgi:hypothetical protein
MKLTGISLSLQEASPKLSIYTGKEYPRRYLESTPDSRVNAIRPVLATYRRARNIMESISKSFQHMKIYIKVERK